MVGAEASFFSEQGTHILSTINFGSQDYLGLAQSGALRSAALEALQVGGVHSAGSPVLGGRTMDGVAIEKLLSSILGKQETALFTTGWAAGFGVVAGLAREEDVIIMDALSHNCLQEGAKHVTKNVHRFAHNDLVQLGRLLERSRHDHPDAGIFVVLEGLYSMDADMPDLAEAMRLARAWDAIVILDVAHDFGSLGKDGLGVLETLPKEDWPEVIMGSFSKTFGANGGFVASSHDVIDYLRSHCPSYVFSNAMSPIQAAVVKKAIEIVFSEEGSKLRSTLMANILRLRSGMEAQGLTCGGQPSPIVPVFVGDEKVARLTSRELGRTGLQANLVEFPAVGRGKARFRFQVMATHTPEMIDKACSLMAEAKTAACAEMLELRAAWKAHDLESSEVKVSATV